MKLVYLADTQIPSRATNGMQIVRMCSAFAANGVDVTLVHPHRFGNRPEGLDGDLWAFYGVPASFGIVTLPTPLTAGLAQHRRFARAVRALPLSAYVLRRSRPGAAPFVVYSRSMLGAWLATRARRLWGSRSSCRGVFLELHDTPGTDGAWEVVRQADGLVAITSALRDHLLTRISAPERVIVAHDGVDLDMFDSLSPSGRRDIRDRLGYDDATTVVGYTGRVNDAKGVPTILEAAELLAGSPVRFLLVGKVYDDMAERAALVPSITMIGFVPPADVSAWTAAMDIVVMSTSAEISYAEFTSPLKVFEYMASGRPVLCSDLPVMREVLTHESNALFFHADCAESLAAGIARIRGDTMLAESIARRARSDVSRYTWDERARRVLAFVTDTLVTSAPI